MKWLRRYNESTTIKATDETIRYIIRSEIWKLGWGCDLNHIDVSEVFNMCYMFNNSQSSVDISRWNVGNVENMSYMFNNSQFNGDISNWNVSNVRKMDSIFLGSIFNGDISGWNVQNVTDMSWMFSYSKFNGDISGWNVQNVTNMSCMFYISLFDGDLSRWNVGNVTNMSWMFSSLKGREPWWYVLYPLFGSISLMWDSLDFKWIDIESKIIYRGKLSKILLRTYNSKWNGKLPEVFGFTYQ